MPAALGLRPRYETTAMKKYLEGGFIQDDGKQADGKKGGEI